MPATEVSVAGEGAGKYSLFGVGGEPRITSWFLACAGREQEWTSEKTKVTVAAGAPPARPADGAGGSPDRPRPAPGGGAGN